MYIASVNSHFVILSSLPEEFWTSGNDINVQGQFQWRAGILVLYDNWSTDVTDAQKNSPANNFIYIRDGFWNIGTSAEMYKMVCEKII